MNGHSEQDIFSVVGIRVIILDELHRNSFKSLICGINVRELQSEQCKDCKFSRCGIYVNCSHDKQLSIFNVGICGIIVMALLFWNGRF